MDTGQEMNNTLTVVTREQVSRWMDGDIASHELELAMKTLCAEETRYCWAELHFVGDAIRGLEPSKAGCADRIRSAIAIEPTVMAPQVKTARQRLEIAQEKSLFASMRKVGRGGRAWATAAAVAAVGFVGTVVYQQQLSLSPTATIAQSNGASQPGAEAGSPVATTSVVARNDDFNTLLQAHRESADASSLYAVRQYLRPAVAMQPNAAPQ